MLFINIYYSYLFIMTVHPYYYIDPHNPYKIMETDFIDEYIIMLFDGTAEFINDIQRIELNLPNDYFDNLRKSLSKYTIRVPMYDIQSNHIYLIYYENIYPRIFHDNYRFIDKNFYNDLLKIENPSINVTDNIRILSHYDINQLQKTYTKIFYKSFVLNHYITSCKRPSFFSGMEHISPYYTTLELYYLAYDWNLVTNTIVNENEIDNLCKEISNYDIPAKTLLDHQIYIYDNKAIGLVKHYSLYGSYYMNIYLRKYHCCENSNVNKGSGIRNIDLENQIKLMIRLIINSPSFIKSYTVYRFVETDDYLKDLKQGDIYKDPSFMSTTRNPFYYQENYSFGYILLKIKLPANIPGIALCIESYSNFPKEEEIILPPTSRFRLEKKIEETETEKHQHILNKRVKRKYEFTWVGNDYIETKKVNLYMENLYEPEKKNVNFMDLLSEENIQYTSIADRLQYFRENFLNMNNQFISKIGDINYVFNMESYNSISVYKSFFYYEVADGIMITSANPKYGNINILLEIGPDIHVNYYFKYSVTDSNELLNLNRIEWIQWLSSLAYIIGCRNVIIHSNYIIKYNKDDTIEQKQMKTRYTYSQDIYQYMKYKKKMFSNFIEVTSNFDYPQLDFLFGLKADDVLSSTDKTELYRIYKNSGTNNMGDFYIYIIENIPKFIHIFEEKMESIYPPELNPFNHISYTLDPLSYLYNNKFIKYIPLEKELNIKKGSFKKLVGSKKIKQFKNRLRTYLLNKN